MLAGEILFRDLPFCPRENQIFYIENGYVIRGMAAAGIGYVGTHPYIKSRYGGWDNASGDLTIEAFRARVKRNSVIMA